MHRRPAVKRIPVAGPSITEKEVKYVTDAVANAWYENAGKYLERFEAAMCDHIGVRHSIALPSCTSALHLALAAKGIGPGDDVVVPDVTWIASSAPISYVGANPVFADIDSSNWCLDPKSFESCITDKTKAVIVVDLYGGFAEMDAIRTIAEKHGIFVIEDAAEALGSIYHGRPAGSLGDVGAFSFHGSKTVTTGEGGMFVTDESEIYERVLFLRDHGRIPGDRMFLNAEVAFKYKMSALQAALGLAQLERLEELVEMKRAIFEWYAAELAGLPGVSLNSEPAGTKNSYWMVTLILDDSFGLDKYALMDHLDRAGIDSRPFFSPLSSIPAYADSPDTPRAQRENRNSYDVSKRGINLPSALSLRKEDVHYVGKVLRDLLEGGDVNARAGG